ncbi:hypothetical protein KIW84_033480 [Lathyrus oleraceus]|uniref:CCHC-type domain-containing protein n=1 Tax=Pisum sativum TaxID=3888 RepID=A0A9D5B366_PEA|nr:hypothetical protein KIW84_033480 [Pisum sativum]
MNSATTPEYDREFPSLEKKIDPITSKTSKLFIHPSEVQPDGKLKPLTQAEEVLNWQSENMVFQNEILQNLDKRMDKITEKIDETDEYLKVLSQKLHKHYRSLKAQVSQLDHDLRQMLEERTFGKTFDQKEREIINPQGQVKEIDDFLRASHERKPNPVKNSFFDPPTFLTYFKQPEKPSPFYPAYVSSPPNQVRYIPTAYRPKYTRTTTPSTSKTKGKASCLSASSSDSQDIPETTHPKIQKEEETPDKGFQAMEITRNCESPLKNYPLVESLAQKRDESSIDGDNNFDQETSTDETPRSVSSKSESEDNYIPRLLKANIKEEESFFEEESPEENLAPKRTKPNGGPLFTFDDIPPRTMKEWYHNLGTFKQDELHHLETTTNILGVLHHEFISDMEIFGRKNRQEFFEMKCCSLKTKDLDKHYHRMAHRYYVLNGYNDPSLKNTYASSLPRELQPKIHRMLATTQRDIKTMSLGQIHQVTLEALKKLCSLHHQFSEVIKQKSKSTHACRKPCLEITCKDKRCSCATKKKYHQQKYTKSHRIFKGKKKKTMKFFRRKPFIGKGGNQRCFICGKKGHFSKECPNNTHKSAKLINSLHPLEGDLESLYSEQSSTDEETIFALRDSSPDEASSSESEDDRYLLVYSFKEI